MDKEVKEINEILKNGKATVLILETDSFGERVQVIENMSIQNFRNRVFETEPTDSVDNMIFPPWVTGHVDTLIL